MSEAQPSKFTDRGDRLLDFMDRYSVVCPRCEQRAVVAVIDPVAPPLFAPQRLTCPGCGYVAEWRGNAVRSRFSDEPRDWYFQRPFWYQTQCRGHELWVFNRRHLDFLRDYVGAQLRARVRQEKGWSNRSLASRLPKWVSAASNRKHVLAALARLERMMDTEPQGGANGRQPSRSDTNRTSAAAASRRSPDR
jgi:hypothetical protein